MWDASAGALGRFDRWVDATAHAERAVALAPTSGAFRRTLGLALARRGEDARALAELQEALRLDPLLPDVPEELAELERRRDELDRAAPSGQR